MVIGVDFDGTCVTHKFPEVGEEIGAARVLKKLTDAGHKLILFTMRSSKKEGTADPNSLGWNNNDKIILESDTLQDAVNWFAQHDIPLYGINENPTQRNWTTSPKVYCELYIDDAALGCPLCYPDGERPYADWNEIELQLQFLNLIK
jgi:hypothetical protein